MRLLFELALLLPTGGFLIFGFYYGLKKSLELISPRFKNNIYNNIISAVITAPIVYVLLSMNFSSFLTAIEPLKCMVIHCEQGKKPPDPPEPDTPKVIKNSASVELSGHPQ